MFAGRLTEATLRALDWVSSMMLPPDDKPQHLRTGQRGEEAAYFYLRRRGYTIIARNFRSPNHRGELDLVGWQGDVLCFIEVKTRTGKTLVPAEMAVDAPKRSLLRLTAGDYLRRLKSRPAVRFDVISLCYQKNGPPAINLFKNAFPMS